MPDQSPQWKQVVARIIALPPVTWLMRQTIRLVVPRHRVGVGVVLLDDNQNVLLLRHVFHPEAPWGIPGGWLNRHESPQAGVLREVREETGLQAALGTIVYLNRVAYPSHLDLVYSGYVTGGTLRLSPEIHEARWFAPEQLPTPMLSGTVQAIGLAVQQARAGTTAVSH